MSYSWAILIIGLVLFMLFELGVFNPNTFAPKAQPGSCKVVQNGAIKSLEGSCNGELPQYVAQFSASASSNIMASVPAVAPATGNSYTITMWFEPTASTNWLGVALTTTPVQAFQIGWATEYSPNGLGWIYGTPTTQNQWSFIAVEGTVGSNGFISVNGGALGDSPAPITVAPWGSSSETLDFGDYTGNQYNVDGLMANIQVYNITLSQQEITNQYAAGIGAAPINLQYLVGWWPLNGNADDYSGNGNNGTPNNVIYTGSWTNGYSTP